MDSAPTTTSNQGSVVLEGDLQFSQSDQSYDCSGYGHATMQLSMSGRQLIGAFRSDSLTNDSGCDVSEVVGSWSGIDNGITANGCVINGEAYDSYSAFDDRGELNLTCSKVGNNGVL